VPIDPLVELHIWPTGQPLPPEPRHPDVHLFLLASQTMPESWLPQSASAWHPHVSLARHTGPFGLVAQACGCFVVHSTQWFIASHTWPAWQSGSFKHCTQACGCTIVLQTPVGAVQSEFWLHGSPMHVPSEPSILVQYSPVLQFVIMFTTRQPGLQVPVCTIVVSQ
jgi:hypothetical protein